MQGLVWIQNSTAQMQRCDLATEKRWGGGLKENLEVLKNKGYDSLLLCSDLHQTICGILSSSLGNHT